MAVDFFNIAKRWQKVWSENKVFEADPVDRPKFFITTPYPYVNGLLHIGHTYTYMRVDALARFKRMLGFNVLFPFAFHATGAPIDTAAQKVAEDEPSQINTLKMMGFSDRDIPKFKDPLHWIKTFRVEAKKDLTDYGMSVDWRRSFITTDLNAHYSKFIEWQFNTLKSKGFVRKGKHPVVWCPKENVPVGDHSRSEGEGETPQEFLLFKHKLDNNLFVITATLRPDTVLGITNLFINPEINYVEAKVGEEKWIMSEKAADNVSSQGFSVKVKSEIKGSELVGKEVEEFDKRKVLVLPASFVDESFGTGIVHSVPSDSADDLIALQDLKKDEKTLKKFNLDFEKVNGLEPIPVLHTPDYGSVPAQKMLDKYKVKSQKEKDKLKKIKQELYKLSHYSATFSDKYKSVFSENLEGKKVEEGKAVISKDLINARFAVKYYELSGKVVCRCLTECIVKIVENQWFLAYSDSTWKKTTHKALQECKLYPEKLRNQFDYVIDWLKDWACTREVGLGTDLPWDKKWKIESLSDSTIYPAFYTIAHLISKIPVEKLDDAFFNHVFLNKGKADSLKVDKTLLEEMQAQFAYWYPVDVRNSGKDLLQNHLTFYLFNHTAVFPEKYWPKGIAVNGFVTIESKKMSKSKGIFKTLRDVIAAYSPDVTRISVLSSGEGADDVDWHDEIADSMKTKLENWYAFALENYSAAPDDKQFKEIDKWMEHQLHSSIKDTKEAMNDMFFRSALQRGFLDLQRHLKWYKRRSAGKMNRKLLNSVINAQTLMLQPFTPHLCEEIWSKLELPGFVVMSEWPIVDENKINPSLEQVESIMSQVVDDTKNVLRLAKIDKPKVVSLFVADNWKVDLFKEVKKILKKTRNLSDILKQVVPKFADRKKEASSIVQKLVKNPSKIPLSFASQDSDVKNLQDAEDFLKSELDCTEIRVIKELDSKEPKAKQAMPGKPAILVK